MILRDLARVDPAPDAERLAVRAGATMAAALLACYAVGRLDLAVYATFGAFTSVYGGVQRWSGRWRQQLGAGALLCLAVTTGAAVATSGHRAWAGVPLAAAWATAGAVASDRYGWRPPGPLFLVFAAATCSAIPVQTHTVLTAAGVASATALLAVALGEAETWVSLRRADRAHEPRPVPPHHPPHRQRIHAARCAATVLVSGAAATSLGIDRPYWAMVASVVPLAATGARAQVVRGLQRLVGTVFGLGLAAALLGLGLGDLAIVVAVVLLQAATELVVVRNYALALVFVTPLALLVAQLAVRQPVGSLLADRLVETALGVVVGVVAAWLTRPRRG